MKKRLIVGLGNIGEKYYNTRHNIGFRIVDEVAKQNETKFEPNNFGQIAKFSYKGRETLLLKPDTFMNLSGNAVNFWMKKEKILPEYLLIIVDDIYLPFATLRLKAKGSNAGHNGLKSIEDVLQTTQYNRLKIGIGNQEFKTTTQVDFVLGQWNVAEEKELTDLLTKANELVLSFVFSGLVNTMNNFNRN